MKVSGKQFLNTVFFGFMLSSCTNHALSPPDTITTIVSAPISSLNPLYATDANTDHVNDLSHAGLVTISAKLIPEPYLAESFNIINKTTLDFRLKRGCTFPNGREITSQDVEKTWRYFIDPQNNSPYLEKFKRIQKMEIVDKYHFRFILEKPIASMPTDLVAMKILSLDAVSPSNKPVVIDGAGPYVVKQFSPSQILLEKRSQPCLPPAVSPKIKVKVVRDDLSRYLKLKNGEIDVVLNELNTRKIAALANQPELGLKTMTSDGISYNYLGINMQQEKLRDPRVRRAIALSFDIPTLLKYKFGGLAKPARNLLADQNFFANQKIPVVERNLEEARKLLDEAGYFNGKNNKPPLRLVLKTTSNSYSIENGRVLVAQAKEAGIDLQQKAYEWGIFYSDVKSGNTELYILRWVGSTDPGIYFEVFHSGEIGRNNRTRYKNPEMDSWIEKAESSMNPLERKKAYDKVQEIAARDLPYISLWHPMNAIVFRKNIQDVTLSPNGNWRPFLTMRKE